MLTDIKTFIMFTWYFLKFSLYRRPCSACSNSYTLSVAIFYHILIFFSYFSNLRTAFFKFRNNFLDCVIKSLILYIVNIYCFRPYVNIYTSVSYIHHNHKLQNYLYFTDIEQNDNIYIKTINQSFIFITYLVLILDRNTKRLLLISQSVKEISTLITTVILPICWWWVSNML